MTGKRHFQGRDFGILLLTWSVTWCLYCSLPAAVVEKQTEGSFASCIIKEIDSETLIHEFFWLLMHEAENTLLDIHFTGGVF